MNDAMATPAPDPAEENVHVGFVAAAEVCTRYAMLATTRMPVLNVSVIA